MDQQAKILQGRLIQIRHVATKQYLKGTIHLVIEKTMFKKKELDQYYLGTTPKEDDFYTYFILQKYQPTENDLRLGDVVAIQNYGQQQFVNLNAQKKSEVTQQCYAYLDEEKHYFVIRPEKDIFLNNQNAIDNSIDKKYVRITSIDNGYSLHSHLRTYKTESVSQYNEVTGYKNCDENDLWELLPVHENLTKGFQPQAQTLEPIQINYGSTIIIRNFWTGWTLHSHKTCYKSTKAQEISLYSYPRDENDFWIIQKLNQEDKADRALRKNHEIWIQHNITKRFLSCANVLSYSQSGYQACGLEGKPMTGLLLQEFENSPLRMNQPFVIKHLTKDLYLSQSKFQTESKIGSQQEAVFVEQFNGLCLWIIELQK
ncbi:unnamed protein product (macronuclear) [Paramecium tetraurelia]|uniref:MIR domain-containing protein n=1 Tax=Paramecium tetraurelia TaxID=5888 RepID=A0CPN6_PARTE|nr:uncharacterized protein GSPATT00009145001 [Paramecium tetraurelia]CAK72753.1 unnamed protein product [Paramecium tetraurelia]|eukprot:XP_001440150.1 hypothetical protein (macronuclear) [Paramecium tetraurelia strain d4-2]